MMTFYTGPEHNRIQREFKALKRYFIIVEGVDGSNAACYRHMVHKLFKALPKEYKEAQRREKKD